jgi:hypothetical protein
VDRYGKEIRNLDNDSGYILRVWLINKNVVEMIYHKNTLSVMVGECYRGYIADYILPLFKE